MLFWPLEIVYYFYMDLQCDLDIHSKTATEFGDRNIATKFSSIPDCSTCKPIKWCVFSEFHLPPDDMVCHWDTD